jgi:hypothetical protein
LKKRLLQYDGLVSLYILFFLLFLLRGLFFCIYDNLQESTSIPLSTARLEEMIWDEETDMTPAFAAEGQDPRMVFDDVNQSLRRVVLLGSFNKAPGELDLYYTKNSGENFSARRRVLAVPIEGGYAYTLPPGKYAYLRLDAGTSETNRLFASELLINPPLPIYRYFIPTLREALALAILPALASCLISLIMYIVNPRVGQVER